MANIALFENGSNLPAFLTSGTDDLAKQLAGSSNNRSISLKGGTFRLVVGGEEIAKKDERFMNVIVLAAQTKIGRAYHAEKFVEGKDNAPPVCWSADGEAPHADSEKPQNANCATCPMNIAGSGENDSRACRYSQRLAVLLENDPQGDVYRVTLPAKSIFGKPKGDKMPLQAYAKFLSGHGAPMGGIVTKMYFDTDEAVPVLCFKGVRALTPEEYGIARTKATSEEALEAITVSYPKSKTADAGPALFEQDVKVAEQAAAVAAAPAAAAEAPIEEPKVRKSTKQEEPAPSTSPSVADLLNEWTDDDAE